MFKASNVTKCNENKSLTLLLLLWLTDLCPCLWESPLRGDRGLFNFEGWGENGGDDGRSLGEWHLTLCLELPLVRGGGWVTVSPWTICERLSLSDCWTSGSLSHRRNSSSTFDLSTGLRAMVLEAGLWHNHLQFEVPSHLNSKICRRKTTEKSYYLHSTMGKKSQINFIYLFDWWFTSHSRSFHFYK